VKKPEPTDGSTYARTNAVLHGARTRGLDSVEELNRVGLLLTPVRNRQIKVDTLRALIESLERWRPAELLRRKLRNAEAGTPNDMYICLLEYVEEYLSAVKEDQ
jgi:hypothetical protein